MGIVGDIFGGILGSINTGYNIYTNKRDYDYQKALQQKIFQREDTAVQRRMADLEAAGLNPNLAAGSAANAGTVVSRSNTNDVNFGAALDYAQAVNSIRQQRQQTENAKIENEILKNQKFQSDMNVTLDKINTFNQLGLEYGVKTFVDSNGKLNFQFVTPDQKVYKDDTKAYQIFDYQFNNLKNSADLLQKDNAWYTADKISGMALGLLPGVNFSFGKKLK